MLVLNRKEGQAIVITVPPSTVERQVVVTAVDTRHDRVRIGFTAGEDIKIHREEVQQAIDRDGGRDGSMRPRETCSICQDPKCDNPGGKH